MRHYINLSILYSILTSYTTVGPFELDWAAQQYKCRLSQYISFTLLACLQAINIFWLLLILRIAFTILMKNLVKDERSDDEEDESDAEEEEEDEEEAGEQKKKGKGKPVDAIGPPPSKGAAARLNGRPKVPLPAAFSSGVDKDSAPNGSAVESAPGTPQSPTPFSSSSALQANGRLEGGGGELKKR